jgi:hydrogenase-4 component E
MTPHPLQPAEALAGTIVVGLILTQLAMFRSVILGELISLYALQSLLVAAICAIVGVQEHGWDLIALAALTLVFKVVLLPAYMRRIARSVATRIELPVRVNVTLSILIAAALTGLALLTAARLPLPAGALLPRADLAATLAIVFIGFLLAILRPNALAQVVAFLTLETGLFFGTVTLAPGLPFVVGVLLLIDVVAAVVVFAVLVRVIVARRNSASIHLLTELRG